MTITAADPQGLFIIGGVVKSHVAESDIQIIEDYLATVLQVQNLVILIGSGASFHLGSPQTRNLKSAAIQELITQSGDSVDSIDTALLNVLNPDDRGDLEELLNGLQLAVALSAQTGRGTIALGDDPSTGTFPVEAIEALRRKISGALAYCCRLPGDPSKIAEDYVSDPMRAHRVFLSRIMRSRRANLPRPRLFTTNYDLVIEQALDELGYPYIDGFSGTVDRRLNLAYYGLDFHRVATTSEHILGRADNALYLHKIHGSLNWRAVAERDASTGFTSLGVHQVPQDAAPGAGRVLIYPTTAKEGDTLAYPYSDLMRLLGDAVQQDNTALICVGYGFADPHINRILLRSLATNPALNVLVADPFAVLEATDLQTAAESDDLIGQSLVQAGFSPKATAIATLAQGTDSRISVLTGSAGKFTQFAELIPEPSSDTGRASPSGIVDLIESLQVTMQRSAEADSTPTGDEIV